MADYRHGAHTVFEIHLHVVWITKYRRPALSGDVAKRVRDLIRDICRDPEVVGGIPATSGSPREAAATGPEEETARTPEEGGPEDGIRSSHGVLQAVRRGPDTDSRNHADGAHVIQRGGKGHVAMENSRPIRVVAGIVPGQRHYRRAGSVAGDAEGAQPGGGAIAHGGIFSPSRAKP